MTYMSRTGFENSRVVHLIRNDALASHLFKKIHNLLASSIFSISYNESTPIQNFVKRKLL